jgi:ribonuclease HI
MAPLHGGSSAGKSDLCCGHSLDVVGRPGLHQSGLMSICSAGCLSPGPRKNDLTIYWALGPFVRSFTLLVDPGDIYPPQTVFCDGSWGTFGAGAAAVLVAPSKVRTCYAVKLDFSCTNNIVEYEALLLGLRKLKAMGIRRAVLKTDSHSGHVDKICKARDPKLEKYLDTVRRLEASFEGFSVKNIPRGENEHADLLAKSAAQWLPLPSEVFFETIKAPSVELIEKAVLNISPVHSEDWRTEIISFLQGNCLSDDEAYNKRIEARAQPYVIIEGQLYKHGVCSPLLKCLSRAEGIDLMKEIHAGLCGSHIGSRPLLGKVFRQGFYWPKAASDAAELVQKCKGCQKCARDQKQPSSLT